LRVESDSETREALNNKVCPKVIENRACPRNIEKKVCPKVIENRLEDEVIQCKSEVDSEDECMVSENMRNVSIVEFVSDNEGNISEVELKLNTMRNKLDVASISIDECQITRNEDNMESTDDCLVLNNDIDLPDYHISEVEGHIANKTVCSDGSAAESSMWETICTVVENKTATCSTDVESHNTIDRSLKKEKSPSNNSLKRRRVAGLRNSPSSAKKLRCEDVCFTRVGLEEDFVDNKSKIKPVSPKRNIFESITIIGAVSTEKIESVVTRAMSRNRSDLTKRTYSDLDSDMDDDPDDTDHLNDRRLETDLHNEAEGTGVNLNNSNGREGKVQSGNEQLEKKQDIMNSVRCTTVILGVDSGTEHRLEDNSLTEVCDLAEISRVEEDIGSQYKLSSLKFDNAENGHSTSPNVLSLGSQYTKPGMTMLFVHKFLIMNYLSINLLLTKVLIQ